LPSSIVQFILYGISLTYLPFVFLFYKNRKIHPIKGRLWEVIIPLDVAAYGLMTCQFLQLLYGASYICYAEVFIADFVCVLCFVLYVYRLVYLLFSYEITKNINELKASQASGQRVSENWYTRNRRFMARKKGFQIVVIYMLFYMSYDLIVGLSIFPALRATVPCGSDEKQMAPLLTSFFGINTLALLFLGGFVYWKFHKNYADAYQMKTEHRLCMTIVGSTLFLYLILVALGQDASVVALPVTFACNIVFLTGTVWPYYLSRKELALTNKTWGLVEELKIYLT